MSNLNVDEANFKSERAVVEEEYRQRILASPYGRFLQRDRAVVVPETPVQAPEHRQHRRPRSGEPGDVTAFHSRYYRPDNATLVVAGDFDPQGHSISGSTSTSARCRARPSPCSATAATNRHGRATAASPSPPAGAAAGGWRSAGSRRPSRAPMRPRCASPAALLSAGESSRLKPVAGWYRQQAGEARAGFEADLRAGPGLLTAYAVAAGGKPLAEVKAAPARRGDAAREKGRARGRAREDPRRRC